jgi:hypothetical protein
MKKSIIRECMRIAREKNSNFPAPMKKHHFSFVVQSNKIVEWGTNVSLARGIEIVGVSAPRYRGYPRYAMLHSEGDAYKKARGILNLDKTFEVINIRLNTAGEILLSKPCDCCFAFLKTLNCNRVWFSTKSGFASLNMKEDLFEED